MEKNIIILQKMTKYCKQSTKYIVDGYTFDDFMKDERTMAFCVINLSQLGELARNLDKELTKKYTSVDWQTIRSLRNRITHDYEGLKYDIIWEIITEDVEPLIEALEKILKDISIEEDL